MGLTDGLHREVPELPLVQAEDLDPSSVPVPGAISAKANPFSTKPLPICSLPQP